MQLEGKCLVGLQDRRKKMIRSKRFPVAVILTNAVVIGGALTIGVLSGKPGLAFKEGELVTYFSTLQLGMCAVASGLNFYLVFSSAKKWSWESIFWIVIAGGFLFGALDEFFMFHERIDKAIHKLLSLQQTPWTDRFDDLIVGLYVGLGAWLIFASARVESFLDQPRRLFAKGLAIAVVMVSLDLLTNGRDFMMWLFGQNLGLFLRTWLSILEDCLKLVAVALFLIGLAQNADLLWSRSRSAALNDENV